MDEKNEEVMRIDQIATDETLAGSHNEVSTDWEQFLKNVTDYGFELGYSRKFVGRTLENDPPMNDEEMIFFNKKNGMILYTQSYNGKSVNSAVVYCEVIEPKEWLPHDKWDVLWGCSSSHNGDGTISVSVDVRQGFKFFLDGLSNAFEFSKEWKNVPHLWFLNYMDTKVPGYDCTKITWEKIQKSSPEVKSIIGTA